MRATKLLSVSVTLWAVVVRADSASAGGVNVPIVRPSIKIVTPSIKPVITPIKPVVTPIKPALTLTKPALTTKMVTPTRGGKTSKLGIQGGKTSKLGIQNANPVGSPPPQHSLKLGGAGTPPGNGNGSAAGLYRDVGIPLNYGDAPAGGSNAARGGSGGAGPPRNYAPPASYNSKTACGRYPYPACQ